MKNAVFGGGDAPNYEQRLKIDFDPNSVHQRGCFSRKCPKLAAEHWDDEHWKEVAANVEAIGKARLATVG